MQDGSAHNIPTRSFLLLQFMPLVFLCSCKSDNQQFVLVDPLSSSHITYNISAELFPGDHWPMKKYKHLASAMCLSSWKAPRAKAG